MATKQETKPAPRPVATTGNDLVSILETHKAEIARVIPRHITPERLIGVAKTAFSRQPLLAKCSARSIAAAMVQASILGLETDGLSGEAFLVPYFSTRLNSHECQMQVGYKGLVRLALNTNQYRRIDADAIHENDYFTFDKGSAGNWNHKWDLRKERGGVIAYYAGYSLLNGGSNVKVMTVAEIDEHRDQYSQSAYKREGGKLVLDDKGQKILTGPWKDSPHWMYCKTPLIQLLKLAPKSNELRNAITLSDRSEAGLRQHYVDDLPRALNPVPDDDDPPDNIALPKAKEGVPEGLISEVQVRRLEAIAKENGWQAAQIAAYLKKEFNIDTLQQLPAREFDSLTELMQMGRDPDK